MNHSYKLLSMAVAAALSCAAQAADVRFVGGASEAVREYAQQCAEAALAAEVADPKLQIRAQWVSNEVAGVDRNYAPIALYRGQLTYDNYVVLNGDRALAVELFSFNEGATGPADCMVRGALIDRGPGGKGTNHSSGDLRVERDNKLESKREKALEAARKLFPLEATGYSSDVGYQITGTTLSPIAWATLEASRADGGPVEMTYVFDAKTMKLLRSWSEVHAVAGDDAMPTTVTGNAALYGAVTLDAVAVNGNYFLYDALRDLAVLDADGLARDDYRYNPTLISAPQPQIGNFDPTERGTQAAGMAYALRATHAYLKAAHGWDGIDKSGQGFEAIVGVGSSWNGIANKTQLLVGSGVASALPLDVVAHELGHALNTESTKLRWSIESQGLSEAFSDMLGTAVEFHANHANDSIDFAIGEELFADGAAGPAGRQALRYQFKPDADGTSLSCYPSGGFGEVSPHAAAGPANRWFYLLSQGSVAPTGTSYSAADMVCNGDAGLVGIGVDKAMAIWMRAFTLYLTSESGYLAARRATHEAAMDIYGINAEEERAVARAWDAVNVPVR